MSTSDPGEKPCMKSTTLPAVAQLDSLLDLCVDVGKVRLNVYFELGGQAIDDEWSNATRQIETKLRQYQQLAAEHGLRGLRVICEPSGGYQDKLLRTARRLGHLTAYVNGEAVAKFRVVETNDSGKTDLKDPTHHQDPGADQQDPATSTTARGVSAPAYLRRAL